MKNMDSKHSTAFHTNIPGMVLSMYRKLTGSTLKNIFCKLKNDVHHLILHIECKTISDSISTSTVVLGLQWSVQISCFLFIISIMKTSHERQAVSNYQSSDCLFNSLWGPTSTKHQSPHYWPFVRGIHWSLVNFPHKESVTWKKFPYDDIIMNLGQITPSHYFTMDYWAQNSAFCLTHWPLGDFKEILGK